MVFYLSGQDYKDRAYIDYSRQPKSGPFRPPTGTGPPAGIGWSGRRPIPGQTDLSQPVPSPNFLGWLKKWEMVPESNDVLMCCLDEIQIDIT